MESINLLGSEVGKKSDVVSVSAKLKMALSAVFVALIVITVASGVYIFINNTRLNSSLNKQDELIASIGRDLQAACEIDDTIGIFNAGHDTGVLRKELSTIPAYRSPVHHRCNQVGDLNSAVSSNRQTGI